MQEGSIRGERGLEELAVQLGHSEASDGDVKLALEMQAQSPAGA